MRALRTALAAAVVGCALAGPAVAMPAEHLLTPNTALVQTAAWVCGPYRCWWRPGPRYWGPYWHRRWYHRPYYRRWRRW
jgi:hypothetical protein